MSAPVEAMCAVELSDREFLLVFASLGVYVDHRGHRSRTQEIMWPSIPNFVSKYCTEKLEGMELAAVLML